VRLRPIKQVGLQKLRDLFQCALPEESHAWIEELKKLKIRKQPYRRIVETIEAQQKKFKKMAVKHAALRVALSNLTPPIEFETDGDLADLCKGMAQMSEGTMYATSDAVELDQSTANVMAAIDAATKEYESDSK
jgi:hypothetical protein